MRRSPALKKEHLTTEGLDKIIAIRASLNWGLSEELTAAFPNTVLVKRPLVQNKKKILDPFWVAGFTSGEGGALMVKLRKSSAYKTGFQVLLAFQITQHSRDEALMRSLIEYLGYGTRSPAPYKETFHYRVEVFREALRANEKIIPFFDKYPIAPPRTPQRDWGGGQRGEGPE
jgi:hypothetical protein